MRVLNVVLAGLLPLAVGLLVHQQGFNFLDDGLWLLGAALLTDGGVLYRDLFTVYGPAYFVVLIPCFALLGKSALALAVLKAITDGVAAALGFHAASRLGARRWAWLVPVSTLALTPVELRLIPVGAFALLMGWTLQREPSRRDGLMVGLAWGITLWFGLDAFAYATVIAVGAIAWKGAGWRRLAAGAPVVGGMVATVAVLGIWGVATGSLDAAFWDLAVYPLTGFRQEMGLSWWTTLTEGAWPETPFSDVHTGETLDPAWPGHVGQRQLALWAIALLLGIVPLAALWMARSRGPMWTCLALFAVAGWLTAAGRGDVTHLLRALLGSLWILPALIAVAPRRLLQGAAVLLLTVATLPLCSEKLWLGAHVSRDSLQRWDRPTARILMPVDRVRDLEATMTQRAVSQEAAGLFWPAQPGMNFIWAIPLATRQTTLLGGEVRDFDSVAAELDATRPPVVHLNFRWKLDGRGLRELCPPAWSYLRSRYRVTSWGSEGLDVVRTLRRVPGAPAAMATVSLRERLNDKEQTVATGMSPDLRSGARVGQSFPVGDQDLNGIQVRWGTSGENVSVPLRVSVFRAGSGGEIGRMLGRYDVDVVIARHQGRSLLQFGPVEGSAGNEVVVVVEATGPASHDVRLLWYAAEGDPRWTDRFPLGTALVNGRPVAADLYFLSF